MRLTITNLNPAKALVFLQNTTVQGCGFQLGGGGEEEAWTCFYQSYLFCYFVFRVAQGFHLLNMIPFW